MDPERSSDLLSMLANSSSEDLDAIVSESNLKIEELAINQTGSRLLKELFARVNQLNLVLLKQLIFAALTIDSTKLKPIISDQKFG
uniref:Uncharacterized protein n=1 Tax=Noccaea caerulescens TaxID=107243 RepID=A0A1J3FM14_NOCCA